MNARFANSLLSHIQAISDKLFAMCPFGDEIDMSKIRPRDLQQLLTMCQAVIARLGSADTTHKRLAQDILEEEMDHDGYKLDRLLGVINSLEVSLRKGCLDNIQELIHGELFDDFIEMANHLLAEGYTDAAAVICGSSLESHLRHLCDKNNIPNSIESQKGDRPKSANEMNQDLVKAGVYEKLDQKNVTAWLDLRNKSAHGEYDKYNKEQVEIMLMGVRGFIARYPA